MMQQKKRRYLEFIAYACCYLVILTGCAPAMDIQAQKPLQPIQIQLQQWPQNSYTEGIPCPPFGKPEYAIFDDSSGYYAIFISSVTRNEGEQYIALLDRAGFTPVKTDSNSVSLGALLVKDGTYVGVNVAEGIMGIYRSYDPISHQK